MKYTLYKDLNTPVYIVNEHCEFFYYSDETPVSAEQQHLLIEHISDWSLPDYKCINKKTGEITSIRKIYEKSLKNGLDPEAKSLIDDYRNRRVNEASIADELNISTRTLRRHYPKNKKGQPLAKQSPEAP